MGRRKKNTHDGLVGLFETGPQEATLQRILDRAVDARVRKAEEQLSRVSGYRFKKVPSRKATESDLLFAFKKALKRFPPPPRPSLRHAAPDTGGKPFHFAVRQISLSPEKQPAKGGGADNRASAHHKYIERLAAIEKPQKDEMDNGTIKAATLATEADTSAVAQQSYIENPEKILNQEGYESSFGNIGETLLEREEFWRLIQMHEREKDARIQTRVICELPYHATPAQRIQIAREFTQKYQALGLRYHAAIHAPGEENDDRNFHVHIVYHERPAQKIFDDVAGHYQWDFAVSREVKDSSRHRRKTYPFRQNRCREFKDRDAIAKERARFCDIVNRVMGETLYDPRSYRDMGLDIVPIQKINKLTAIHLKQNRAFLQHEDWTPERLTKAIAKAVSTRANDFDQDLLQFKTVHQTLEGLQKSFPNISAMNKVLKGQAKYTIEMGHRLSKSFLQALAPRRLAIEHEVLQEKIITQTALDVCERFIAIDASIAAMQNGSFGDIVTEAAMAELADSAKVQRDKILSRSRQEKDRLKAALHRVSKAFNEKAAPLGYFQSQDPALAAKLMSKALAAQLPVIEAGFSALHKCLEGLTGEETVVAARAFMNNFRKVMTPGQSEAELKTDQAKAPLKAAKDLEFGTQAGSADTQRFEANASGPSRNTPANAPVALHAALDDTRTPTDPGPGAASQPDEPRPAQSTKPPLGQTTQALTQLKPTPQTAPATTNAVPADRRHAEQSATSSVVLPDNLLPAIEPSQERLAPEGRTELSSAAKASQATAIAPSPNQVFRLPEPRPQQKPSLGRAQMTPMGALKPAPAPSAAQAPAPAMTSSEKNGDTATGKEAINRQRVNSGKLSAQTPAMTADVQPRPAAGSMHSGNLPDAIREQTVVRTQPKPGTIPPSTAPGDDLPVESLVPQPQAIVPKRAVRVPAITPAQKPEAPPAAPVQTGFNPPAGLVRILISLDELTMAYDGSVPQDDVRILLKPLSKALTFRPKDRSPVLGNMALQHLVADWRIGNDIYRSLWVDPSSLPENLKAVLRDALMITQDRQLELDSKRQDARSKPRQSARNINQR